MHSIRDAGRIARLLLSVAFAWSLCWSAARASVTTLDGSDAPIVRIMIQEGDITIRTWDRPEVAIEGDPSLQIERKIVRTGPSFGPITIPVARRQGPEGIAQLPAESFPVTSLQPVEHDQILVRAIGADSIGNVTVTIPNTTQLLVARTVRGDLKVSGYHNGTLVAFDNQGRLAIDDFSGDAFAQVGAGSLVATDSTFARARMRVLYANAIFERCRAKQIEATSVVGDIVYDNGTFDEGLARFDAQSGSVAIGAAGPTTLGGHVAGDGRLYTLFDRPAGVQNRNGDATAQVDGGGASVNATSATGNVFFYDGSLRTKTRIPAEWRLPQQVLFRDPFREFQMERKQALPRRAFGNGPRRFLRAVRARRVAPKSEHFKALAR